AERWTYWTSGSLAARSTTRITRSGGGSCRIEDEARTAGLDPSERSHAVLRSAATVGLFTSPPPSSANVHLGRKEGVMYLSHPQERLTSEFAGTFSPETVADRLNESSVALLSGARCEMQVPVGA